MWVGWDGVGLVIIGHRYSNKEGHTNPRGLVDINDKSHRIWTHELKKGSVRDITSKGRHQYRKCFLSGIAGILGGGGSTYTELSGPFSRSAFLSDPSPIVALSCHSVTDSVLLSNLFILLNSRLQPLQKACNLFLCNPSMPKRKSFFFLLISSLIHKIIKESGRDKSQSPWDNLQVLIINI